MAIETYSFLFIVKQIKLRWEREFCTLDRLSKFQTRYLSTELVEDSTDSVFMCCKSGEGLLPQMNLSDAHASLAVIHICYSYYKHFLSDC